ncbi:prolactin receptor-like isoform X1 [Clupea harengus]|uniref:Prolactin receptor-like isoform X1 n=2 Tax=Clupea harengus TaxID=7950 RepID=A0A6P8EE66_CLUHA|nr:prolactin receptor-like isoform X1 [Clupea harengus]
MHVIGTWGTGLLPCVMQCFLFFTLACLGLSSATRGAHNRRDAALTPSRPQIYHCRSPNMETFTCWWHPLENASSGNEMVNYTFSYTIENEHRPRECPDYVTGGPNSCYFDTAHTRVWEVYCMNVTARSSRGAFTSQEHCLDVADIVEIDPPFNLTYTLMNNSEGESGRTALVSWSYPIPSLVHIGWITLLYELRFRTAADPGNWKVKGLLREPQLELLDLPVGTYEVMVRCRSKNNNIWSQWSAPLVITVPLGHTGADRMLALILITGVGVMAVLIIGFGVIPQSKRIKAFLLPPIPKPHIRGLDPTLLKKGKMDEINRHFSSFHGYKSPQYREESWYQVYTDEGLSGHSDLQSQPINEKITEPPAYPHSQQITPTSEGSRNCQGPTPYIENPASYVTESMDLPAFPESPVSPWATGFGSSHPQQVPSTGYSLIENSAPGTSPGPAVPTLHDFYTCVNVVSPSGAVHLVPFLPEGSKKAANRPQGEEDSQKNSQMAAYLAGKMEELVSGSASVNQGELGETQGTGAGVAADLLSQPK